MPLNKEAYLRYKIIDDCISNKRKPYPSMEDIMVACEERIGKSFTISTIQKDIKAMKEDQQLNFHAPIKYSKSKEGYYYTDPEYNIGNIPLSSDEKEKFAKELEFLNILGDNNLSDEFKGAQIKLLQFLSPDNNLKKEKIPLSVSQTPAKKLGLYNYNFLIDHIKKREVIEMAYYSMELQEPIDIIVHPYQLLEFDHRWYLLGYSQEEKKLRVYGLDRVLVIFSQIKKIKFNDSKRKEVLKYNKDMYGVYPLEGEKKQYVTFYVAKSFDHIMQTNPLHSSQKIIDSSPEYITLYGINVIPTHELLQWFLAHLGDVKMASPMLAFEIARKLNQFHEDYTKGYFDEKLTTDKLSMTKNYKRGLKAIEEKFASHKKLAEKFISESIKTEDPAGLCFVTSFSLLIYLATKQIKSHLITAKVPKEKPDDPNFKVDHYFLQIDNDGTILDPTIQQFNKDVEPIYIGKPIDCEVTKKYELCDLPFKNWFPKSHESWSKPYVDTTYPLNEPFEKRSIMYTLKLATTLNTEIKNTKSIDELTNEYFGLYFKPIYIFLYNWHTGNIDFEIEKEKLPRGFNNLLSDALQWAKNERAKYHR